MNISDVIGWVLKLKVFAGYRAKIGAAALLVGLVLSTIQTPEFMAAFPGIDHLPGWLQAVGAYVGIIGSRYKDDSN